MSDHIARATVEGDRPVFINGVLHLPGEDASVDLKALGVDGFGKKTPGLTKKSAKTAEDVVQTPIAAVAPHAPDAPNPQGLATGTRQSGTGRLIAPTAPGENTPSPVGADAPVTKEERKEAAADTKQQGSTQKPSPPSK
jgi:hypothetical protein